MIFLKGEVIVKNKFIVKIDENVWIRDVDTEEVLKDENFKNFFPYQSHLCSNCDNCYADKCTKVMDITKKPINKYDYISNGAQIFDDNGESAFFYVRECNNYKADKERHKPSTKEELDNLKRMKESIKIAYFDAENIEEADQTQYDLFRRKLLVKSTYDCTARIK